MRSLRPVYIIILYIFNQLSLSSVAMADWRDRVAGTLNPGRLQVGVDYSYPRCPCLRVSFQADVGGGRIETRHLLITSPGLLQFRQLEVPDFSDFTQRMFRIGALEILEKDWHLGLGFRLDLGRDRDAGMRDIRDLVVYLIGNIVQRSNLRMDVDAGIRARRMRVNSGPVFERDQLFLAAVLGFSSTYVRGEVNVAFSPNIYFPGIDPAGFLREAQLSAGARIRARVLRFFGMELGANLAVSGEIDRFLDLAGIVPENARANFFLDLQYIRDFGTFRTLDIQGGPVQ